MEAGAGVPSPSPFVPTPLATASSTPVCGPRLLSSPAGRLVLPSCLDSPCPLTPLASVFSSLVCPPALTRTDLGRSAPASGNKPCWLCVQRETRNVLL